MVTASATAALAGTAVGPLTITPSTSNIGNIVVGATSTPPTTFTVQNSSAAGVPSVTGIAVNFTGTDFNVVANTCAGATLAPGANAPSA